MSDSIYHMTLKILNNHIFGEKTLRFCHLLRNVIMEVITLCTTLKKFVRYKRKYVHEVLVNRLFKLSQKKVWLVELTVPP